MTRIGLQLTHIFTAQTAYQPPTYQMDKLTEAPLEFAQDSKKFLSRTTKPNRQEYLQIVRAVGAGFLMMGAIGYVVKLVHIPIRHLITV